MDVFVASFDSSGAYRWSRSIGGTLSDGPGGIALANGIVHANGLLKSEAVDTANGFLISFDETGADRVTSPPLAVGNALGVDAKGNAYAAGRFSGTANLGGGELVGPSTSSEAVWVASFDGDLKHRWSLAFEWQGPPAGPNHLAIGPDGAIYLIGNMSVPVETDGGTFVGNLGSGFLVKLVEDC
jgi:hypothetical protein